MAAASASSLEEDLSCSVCCDIFREPVLLGCGHSFCRECLSRHWSSSPGRRCPVCRGPSPQEPLLNISLRSTCESFLQQQKQQKQQQQQEKRDGREAWRRKGKRKEEEKEEENNDNEEDQRDRLCPLHGQKMVFFCETEEKPICSKCKQGEHRGHRVLSVQKAVKERKGKLLTAMRHLKQKLAALTSRQTGFIDTQDVKTRAEDTERKIKRDFEQLHNFLRDEEATRLSALRREAEFCNNAGKAKTIKDITHLSRRVKDLEEKMETQDAIRFLQDFNSTLAIAQSSEPAPARLDEDLDMAKHLRNLKFRVWENMKGIAPYYPVTLDPNAVPSCLSLSDDLTRISNIEGCLCLVPGSEGIADDSLHSWDVDVGDENAEWMLGLMTRTFIHGLAPVCPEYGIWAIQRSGGAYQALTALTSQTPLHLTRRPRVVRVQLWGPFTSWKLGSRTVRFLDALDGTEIFTHSGVPCAAVPVYPFLFPMKRPTTLSLLPAEVNVTVGKDAGFMEKNVNSIMTFIVCGFLFLLLIVSWTNSEPH